MQQRQLRLGDILDDYCPRERRLTNHAVVAMIGPDVKRTRCTTCDAEHEYKHAKVPRQRRKAETPPALYSQVLAGAPKRIAHEAQVEDNGEPVGAAQMPSDDDQPAEAPQSHVEEMVVQAQKTHPAPDDDEPDSDSVALVDEAPTGDDDEEHEAGDADQEREEGPVHRPLIRASLPRPEGQAPPARPAPDFTIRQPGGRPNRFRPRHQRGGQQFRGDAAGGPMRGGPPRAGGGRPPQGAMSPRLGRHHGPGRKRSK